ncbi:hypothetical protein MKZ38_003702 [Zalerion maritima]|uniref:DUF4604 domain-containing protein n=1 Tax=Zalerion maritima TaxID=339359 RepID=A0AAD5RXL6_9PEZI|nr:hypothetical protein MKZ38_003702 [Zalerion maritima]
MPKQQPLEFNRRIPAFLQQMQNAQASQYDQPNPQLTSNRRHGKPRSKSEDAEDAPLVLDHEGNVVEGASVDVHGEVVSLNVAGAEGSSTATGWGTKGKTDEGKNGQSQQDKEGEEDGKREKVASIGNVRKRKAGRVIGGEAEDDADLADDPLAKAIITAQGRSTVLGKDASKLAMEEGKSKKTGEKAKKKKKRAKKIKLSFEEDED